MTNLPAIPDPSAVDIATVGPVCEQLVLWAQTTDDAEQLRDARDRLSAIDKYAQQRNLEGRNVIAAAMRRIEARIGELLNAAGEQRGGRPDRGPKSKVSLGDALPNRLARAARKMANHPGVLDEVIAGSTDENPATRKRVLDAIDPPKPVPPVEQTVRLVLPIREPEAGYMVAAAKREGVSLETWAYGILLAAVSSDGRGKMVAKVTASKPRDVAAAVLNGHEHKAGVALSGGISPCTVSGCGARKVLGRWVEVA